MIVLAMCGKEKSLLSSFFFFCHLLKSYLEIKL